MAVVAHVKECANGDMLRARAEMYVHVEGGEGEGFAFGVGGYGRSDRLAANLRSGTGSGCGLAVVVD
jgi:hypothetical protein